MLQRRPESLGAVCALIYLLTIIVFIPFPFYKDMVAATSGGGEKDISVSEDHQISGRSLHRFPHSKVRRYLPPILIRDDR